MRSNILYFMSCESSVGIKETLFGVGKVAHFRCKTIKELNVMVSVMVQKGF